MDKQPMGWSSVCIAIDTSISHCKDTVETEQFPRTTVRFLFVFALSISRCKNTAAENDIFSFLSFPSVSFGIFPDISVFFSFFQFSSVYTIHTRCKDTAPATGTFRLLHFTHIFAVYCSLAVHFFRTTAKIRQAEGALSVFAGLW